MIEEIFPDNGFASPEGNIIDKLNEVIRTLNAKELAATVRPAGPANSAMDAICRDYGGDNAMCIWGGKVTCGASACKRVKRHQ